MICHDHDCAPEIAALKAEVDRLTKESAGRLREIRERDGAIKRAEKAERDHHTEVEHRKKIEAQMVHLKRTLTADLVRPAVEAVAARMSVEIARVAAEVSPDAEADRLRAEVDALKAEVGRLTLVLGQAVADHHARAEKIAEVLRPGVDRAIWAEPLERIAEAAINEIGDRGQVETDLTSSPQTVAESIPLAFLSERDAACQDPRVYRRAISRASLAWAQGDEELRADLSAAHRAIARLSSGETIEGDGLVCTFPDHSNRSLLAQRDDARAEVDRLTRRLFDSDMEVQRLTRLCAEHERTIATAARVAAGVPVDEGARHRQIVADQRAAVPHAPANTSRISNSSHAVDVHMASSLSAPATKPPAPVEAASPTVATAGVTSAGVSLPQHGRARWVPLSDRRHPGHAAWVRERAP